VKSAIPAQHARIGCINRKEMMYHLDIHLMTGHCLDSWASKDEMTDKSTNGNREHDPPIVCHKEEPSLRVSISKGKGGEKNKRKEKKQLT
jgi:hypothetical protein